MTPQEIQFERLKLCQYNDMDGKKVAALLEKEKKRWKAFMLCRVDYHELIELRDMASGILNTDTLFILTEEKHIDFLTTAFKKLSADEIGYINSKNEAYGVASDPDKFWQVFGGGLESGQVVMRIWWD